MEVKGAWKSLLAQFVQHFQFGPFSIFNSSYVPALKFDNHTFDVHCTRSLFKTLRASSGFSQPDRDLERYKNWGQPRVIDKGRRSTPVRLGRNQARSIYRNPLVTSNNFKL